MYGTITYAYHMYIIENNNVIVISKLLKYYSKAKRTSLFTSAATNQRVFFQRVGSREAQVRFLEYQEGIE